MLESVLTSITALFSGVWGYLIAALGGVAALVASNVSGRRSERKKGKIKDFENAQDIRDRVDRELPERLREYEDSGFRDD